MRIKSAVLRQCGAPRPFAQSEPIRIEEIELDGPQPGELLVKVGGGGLCHSDLSMLNGDRPRPTPLVVGHEGAGEVVEVGAGVRDIVPGDKVVFQFSASCGRCSMCLSGKPQLCEAHAVARAKGELMGGGKRFRTLDGEPIAHQSGVSCFSEYTVVDRGSAVRITQDISLADAAIFGCAVMTGAGAALNTARVRPGDKVAVIGLGGVGLTGMMGALVAGAEQVIAVDVNADKLGLARQLGAHATVDARDPDHLDQIKDLTGGGVDFAFEFAGAIPAMETAYKSIGRGGAVVVAGLVPIGAEFTFEPHQIVNDEKAIMGSYMGSCVPVRDIPLLIDLYLAGKLPVDKLIDRTVGFEELNAGFDKLADGTTVRQILVPHGD